MTVVPIRKENPKQTKIVGATQKEVDKLPLHSGTWSIAGMPEVVHPLQILGEIFCATSGRWQVGRQYLGPLSVKEAKERAHSCLGSSEE